MKYRLYILSALLFGLLSVCIQAAEQIDQSKMCQVSNDDQARECVPGELVYYSSNVYGNELDFAAVHCDFNFQVMHTNGNVICVYSNKRLSVLVE